MHAQYLLETFPLNLVHCELLQTGTGTDGQINREEKKWALQVLTKPCATKEGREPQGVEEAGCKIYSGAPTVSQTTG